MRRKAARTDVRCTVCHQVVPSTFGFVPDIDEPGNHVAPCGLPCIAGGISIDETQYHDTSCTRCVDLASN